MIIIINTGINSYQSCFSAFKSTTKLRYHRPVEMLHKTNPKTCRLDAIFDQKMYTDAFVARGFAPDPIGELSLHPKPSN